MKYHKIFLLIFVVVITSSLIPNSFCQEPSNSLRVSGYVNIDKIYYEEGKLSQNHFHLTLDVNSSFGIVIFSPTLEYSSQWDNRTSFSEGWHYLSQDYFPRDLELGFSYDELLFDKEILEYGILFGINVTTQDMNENSRQVSASIDSSLRAMWEIEGTIEEVTKEEGAKYVAYGISLIDKRVETYNIKQLFLLRIQLTRKYDCEQKILVIPPVFMLGLLIVSILLIWKNQLSDSLKVYLAVAFPSITYLTYLKENTPPVMTFVENLTLFVMIMCFLFAIAAVLCSIIKSGKKDTETKKQQADNAEDKKSGNEPKIARHSDPKKNEEKPPEDQILSLIRFVDCKEFVLFKDFDVFKGVWGITFASLIAIFILLLIDVVVEGIILKTMPILNQITLSLTTLGLFFTYFALTTKIGEKQVIDIRFKRATGLKHFTEDEKPILKALIKLRSRNPKMDLERISKMHPEMFTKEKLLETLYSDTVF